jgi:hypothetical protein
MKLFSALLLLTSLCTSTAFSQSENQLSSRRISAYKTEITEVKNQKKQLKSEQITLNKSGECIEEKVLDDSGNIVEWRKFERARDGRILNERSLNSKGNVSKSKNIIYDRFKKIESETTADSNGVVTEKIIYTYNENGEKSKEQHYRSNNELKKTTDYSYDKKGMLVLKRTTNDKGEVIFLKQITYEY